MASDSKQEIYAQAVRSGKQVPRALGLGLVSAVSAIAGGVAVAWWYRKTLTKLQNPIALDDSAQIEAEGNHATSRMDKDFPEV